MKVTMTQYVIPEIMLYFNEDAYYSNNMHWIDYSYEQYIVFSKSPNGNVIASLKFGRNYGDHVETDDEIRVIGKDEEDAKHQVSRVLADYFTEERH